MLKYYFHILTYEPQQCHIGLKQSLAYILLSLKCQQSPKALRATHHLFLPICLAKIFKNFVSRFVFSPLLMVNQFFDLRKLLIV